MAGFYYRDHLFVNIIYTLRGGGFAAAHAPSCLRYRTGGEILERVAFRHGGRFFVCSFLVPSLRIATSTSFEEGRIASNEPSILDDPNIEAIVFAESVLKR